MRNLSSRLAAIELAKITIMHVLQGVHELQDPYLPGAGICWLRRLCAGAGVGEAALAALASLQAEGRIGTVLRASRYRDGDYAYLRVAVARTMDAAA